MTTQLRCPPLAGISAPCNAEQKAQHFIEKARKPHGVMAEPTSVRSNRFGVRCSAPPCPPALQGKASKTSPAREKKASPHQCDLTDSVPSISLNTGVRLSLPGPLGHRGRVGRGTWPGQSAIRVHPPPLQPSPQAGLAVGRLPSGTGQLQTHVCTTPRQPTYALWHQVTAACILRLLLQGLTQRRALRRGCAGARTDPGDSTDAVTRSALPWEARCRRAGSPRRGKAFDVTTSPRTPLPLGYPIV